MSSSVHVDNKGKDILILGEGPTQGLDDTTLTAEAKYPINFVQSGKRFVLSLHYNGSNSFLFVNATKVYQLKAKSSEIKDYALCFGNISKDFTINNLKITGLKGVVNFFSFDLILVNGSSYIKSILLSNQKCMIQPTLINLHPNEYSQEFHYYPFTVKLDRCVGSCNTLNDLSIKYVFQIKQKI